MASVRGLLNIQSLNELTYENVQVCTTGGPSMNLTLSVA